MIKKEKKADNAKRRTLWKISPTTRIVKNGKIYNRQKEKTKERSSFNEYQ